jgi:hypothetical protein
MLKSSEYDVERRVNNADAESLIFTQAVSTKRRGATAL